MSTDVFCHLQFASFITYYGTRRNGAGLFFAKHNETGSASGISKLAAVSVAVIRFK